MNLCQIKRSVIVKFNKEIPINVILPFFFDADHCNEFQFTNVHIVKVGLCYRISSADSASSESSLSVFDAVTASFPESTPESTNIWTG